jgi:predicted negative regulator of RcsB-dependent stress response
MDSDTPPSAGFYNLLGWFEANKQRVVVGACALAVLGAIVGFFVWRSGQRALEAEEALSSVRMPFVPSEMPAPGTAEALAGIADEFPKTQAAPKARLRAGTVYFDQGNYAKAQEQFEKFLREHGDTLWTPQAVLGIAACLDAQNKVNEAITKYSDFITRYSSDPAVDQARLSLARLYEQTKQPALALDVLRKMTDAQAGPSASAQEAQEKIRELFTKHPELVPPPQPPLSITPGMFTNVPSASTNVLNVTNVVRPTNPPLILNTNAPRILLNPGPTNAGN